MCCFIWALKFRLRWFAHFFKLNTQWSVPINLSLLCILRNIPFFMTLLLYQYTNILQRVISSIMLDQSSTSCLIISHYSPFPVMQQAFLFMANIKPERKVKTSHRMYPNLMWRRFASMLLSLDGVIIKT